MKAFSHVSFIMSIKVSFHISISKRGVYLYLQPHIIDRNKGTLTGENDNLITAVVEMIEMHAAFISG